jgi:hypothetical protein
VTESMVDPQGQVNAAYELGSSVLQLNKHPVSGHKTLNQIS